MAKTCREAFEEGLYGNDGRKRRDGQYTQDFIRRDWSQFQAGWWARGRQCLADSDGPDLGPQLTICAEGDDGE
jgi:hypothetical protein